VSRLNRASGIISTVNHRVMLTLRLAVSSSDSWTGHQMSSRRSIRRDVAPSHRLAWSDIRFATGILTENG
jgi:hypothetical protein